MKTTPNYMILAKTSRWGRFIFDSAQKIEISEDEDEDWKEEKIEI